jgi:hypothetical protein
MRCNGLSCLLSLRRNTLSRLEAAEGDDTAVAGLVLAQAPSVIVRLVQEEVLSLGDSCVGQRKSSFVE